jgi:hypothetical protein
MQNEHTQILSFLAIHDLSPLLVSDLAQHLLAPGGGWWHHWVPTLGQQNGWVQHASCLMLHWMLID